MNEYDPATVFSSIDREGRYAYGNQPPIAEWNLSRFAETLLPLLSDSQEKAVQLAQDALSEFYELYNNHWLSGMRAKLGIFHEEAKDAALIAGLLDMMQKYHADFTNTFIALTFDKRDGSALFTSREFGEWYALWQERLKRQNESKSSCEDLMRRSNPALIPRNHRVEEALDAAVKDADLSDMHRLLDALANPYAHTPQQAEYAPPPAPSACTYRTFCGT
jgi:uncharacterized protein YdiU (UPF0061 family)